MDIPFSSEYDAEGFSFDSMDQLTYFFVRQIWPSVPARRLGERLPDYITKKVLKPLDLEEATIDLEKVESGKITTVRRWVAGREGALYIRAWPWDPRKRPAHSHVEASKLFGKAGINVPGIVHFDDSFATMKQWRLETAIESEAPGVPLDPLRRPEHRVMLPEVARQLSRLHDAASAQWGTPWRPENGMADPRSYWAGRLGKFRTRITPKRCGLSGTEMARGLDQLEERLNALELRWPVLIHGDLNPAHLRLSRKKEITWIDFGTVQYGLREQDLASVRANLCPGDLFEEFMRVYGQYVERDAPVDLDAITTFTILGSWERLNSRIKRQLHRQKKHPEKGDKDPKIQSLRGEQRRSENELKRHIEAGQ